MNSTASVHTSRIVENAAKKVRSRSLKKRKQRDASSMEMKEPENRQTSGIQRHYPKRQRQNICTESGVADGEYLFCPIANFD